MAVDRKEFCVGIGKVDKAKKEDKVEVLLARPLLLSLIQFSLDFFGLTEEVARPITHSLSTNRRGGDCWGWPRLVRVSVSSTDTCSPPNAMTYSASATDATTTGMAALAEGVKGGVVGYREHE